MLMKNLLSGKYLFFIFNPEINNFIHRSIPGVMKYPDPKYFDYAASCPPFQEALDKFTEMSARHFANPSSSHRHGLTAQKEMLSLKKEFCDLVHFYDGRLLLCSSGTEANNTIIEGHMHRFPQARLLIAEDAHDCIWYATKKYARRTKICPIDRNGLLNLDTFRGLITKNISMVCINHASHELGTIHPVTEIAEITTFLNVKLLVDGVQAMGKIPVDLSTLSCDYYSFSAHKFGGPRSVGGVLIRDDQFEPLLQGGKQEWSLRAGTENLPGLAACLVALKSGLITMREETIRLKKLSRYFQDELVKILPDTLINSPIDCVPGLVSLSFPGESNQEIIAALSLSGYALSAGSACQAGQINPSRILLALGRSPDEAKGTLRISMGYGTTPEAVDTLIDALVEYVQKQS